MRILDTNSITHIFASNIHLGNTYFISPDIKDESEITELIFGMKLSQNIKEISQESIFNEAVYFRNYKVMLNKYGDRSFYNMTGFGDISILALVATLNETYGTQSPARLPGMEEEILIYTGDMDLRDKIIEEFDQSNADNLRISVFENSEIA